MNYSDFKIALQEVPGEISICFTIHGCELHCKGCHSAYLWNKDKGEKLTLKKYTSILEKYKSLASCVLFMGGEWFENELVNYFKIAKAFNYTTCLYTGQTQISKNILNQLTWIKTGPWVEALGGLDSPKTNQEFKELKTNKILNHLFQKN